MAEWMDGNLLGRSFQSEWEVGGQKRGMREDMIKIHYSYLKLLTHMLNISQGLERETETTTPTPTPTPLQFRCTILLGTGDKG